MSTRTSECRLIAALLVLSSCDRDGAATAKVDPNAPDTVRCQVAGATELEPVCRSELTGDLLTIRHPDGGFRRFRIVKDGRGIIAADGSKAARVTLTDGNSITVEIDGDRYDLPATVANRR